MSRAPRWPGLLLALGVLWGGGGCPGPGECFNSPTSQQPDKQLFEVGREVSLQVPVGVTTFCDGDTVPQQVPQSVTVEVYGPENEPISATAQLSPGGERATVRFTPVVTGRFHVLVAFAPVGSLQQFGVFVAEDRRQEAPMERLTWTTTCPYVDRTLQGTWLCGPLAMRGPQGTLQALSNDSQHTVVAGDVVWVVDGARVVRYVDTGTGPLVSTGDAAFPPDRRPGDSIAPLHTRLATGDELLLLGDTHLYRYTFSAQGAVSAAPATRWTSQYNPGLGLDQTAGLMVRAGARVLVVGVIQDTVTFELRAQACPFQVSTATGAYIPVPHETCQRLVGDVVGYEDGVVWTRTSAFSNNSGRVETLRRYEASGGQLVEESALALDGQMLINVPPLRPGPTFPSLLGSNGFGVGPYAAPRWRAEKRALELELIPAPFNTSPARLGQRYLWTESQGGGVAVYPRVRPSNP
ncbi:MAG TPA: hypothetical protein VE153_35905 [Myxococcus sp.]|nr:hypothetical protein [Myxococcus sp.]